MSSNVPKKQKEERKKFKSWENPKIKDTYIRFATETLKHETFKSLSSNAKVLYMYMKDWAYKNKEFLDKQNNNGRGELEYSISLAKSILNCSTQTASNTIHELEQKGFIERQNNSAESRQTSIWKFTDKWHIGIDRYMV